MAERQSSQATLGAIREDFANEIPSNLLQIFLNQVDRTPDGVAMIDTASLKSTSFQQLHTFALKLSSRIASMSNPSYQKNEFVAILLPASVQLVKATLAIWLAGKIPVPLNIDYPVAQLKYIIEDQLKNPLIVTRMGTVEMIGLDLPDPKSQIVSPDGARQDSTSTTTSALCNEIAYCFFTSGSTGRPKGVLVKHSSYVNVVNWAVDACKLTSTDRSSVVCSPAFDISVLEIWPVLCVGGCLCLPRNHYRYDAQLLAEWIHEECITITALPTAVASRILANEEKNFNHGPSKFTALRWMLVGGEALLKFPSPELPFRIMNMYGPTETAVLATCIPIDQEEQRTGTDVPSIGKPINDQVRVYVLNQDDDGLITQPGEIGEICIAGAGVARGYLNQPQLTAEKFIPNLFAATEDQRYDTIYKSGDLGYWNSDGNLCYVGRRDTQIKFHGYRIELGNIEQALGAHSLLDQAVVLVEGEKGTRAKVLVAYCAVNEQEHGHGGFNAAILQMQDNLYPFLQSQLGHYEIPSQIYILPPASSFPLTTSGKIDRGKLPELKSVAALITSNHEPLETEYEIMVAQVWSELLNVPYTAIGRRDNFFGVGGTSMIALQMLQRLQCMIEHKCLKISGLHLHHIFRAQTVFELAELVELSIVSDKKKTQDEDVNMIPLSQSQQFIWSQMMRVPQEDWGQFNHTISIKFREVLDVAVLQSAVDKILRRHDVLSYTFHFNNGNNGGAAHFVHAEIPQVETIYLCGSGVSWQESCQILDNNNSSAPLASGEYLARFFILKLGQNYNVHIIGQQILLDVTSFNIIIWELQQLIKIELGYEEVVAEADLQLKPKYQYVDYARWQDSLLASEEFKTSFNFWASYLNGWSPIDSFNILGESVDLHRSSSYAGLVLPFRLDAQITKKLEDHSKEKHTTVYNLLVTAFTILIHAFSSATKKSASASDIVILSIVLGRDQLEFNETVGRFTNPIAIRSKNVDKSQTFGSLAQQLQENIATVYEHSQVPYQHIVNSVGAGASTNSDPRQLFNFCMNMTPRSPTHLKGTRNMFQTYEANLTSQKIMLTFEEVNEEQNTIDGFLEANTNIFATSQLKLFVESFQNILEAGVSCPTTPIESLSTISSK